MIDTEKYISVLEYSQIMGISKQAVYKQLKGKLKDFYIVVDGKKYIDKAVLNLADNQPTTNFSTNRQPTFQPFWESQLAEKDKQIESLLKQIETLQEQNGKLTDLLANSQTLLAVEKKLYIEQETSGKHEKKGILRIFKKNK